MIIAVAFPKVRVQADAAMRNGGAEVGAKVGSRAAVIVEAGAGPAIHLTVGGEKNTNTVTDTRESIVVEAEVAIEIERRNTTNIDIQAKATNIAVSIQMKMIDIIVESTKNEIVD